LATITGFLALRDGGNGDGGNPVGRGSTSAVKTERPRNLVEQIAQLQIWVRPPTTFKSAADAHSEDSNSGLEHVILCPSVVDSRDLVDNAFLYEGDFVFLVGRVVRIRTLDDRFGVDTEYQLATVRGTDAYVAASPYLRGAILDLLPVPQEGDVVYAAGKLAAIGDARAAPSAPIRSSAYFITDENVGVGKYERRARARRQFGPSRGAQSCRKEPLTSGHGPGTAYATGVRTDHAQRAKDAMEASFGAGVEPRELMHETRCETR
jgi:hypothetical protein